MSKKIPDIVHELEEDRASDHKPRNSHANAYGGSHPYGAISQLYNPGEAVLVRVGEGNWKGGVIQSYAPLGFKRIYKIKLSSAHGGTIIEACAQDLIGKK